MGDPLRPATGNRGVQNLGSGSVNICQSAVGDNASVRITKTLQPATRRPANPTGTRWDVGVITVLSEETRAVTEALASAGDCRKRTHRNGLRFLEADISNAGGRMRVVSTQALDHGQRPAVIAFERLRQHYSPVIVVLVGIAGGIHPAIGLGDVVLVQEVIYYDLRKETPAGIFRRGQSRPVPAPVRYAINDFLSDHGEPYRASFEDRTGVSRTFKVVPGPIGSGEAVIAHKESDIRDYLTHFNDKTLALETETGGLAEAFYEMADSATTGNGWLGVRGISDHADADKDDAYHDIASWHAASTLIEMLPYLTQAGKSQSES
jgi:adenosylhomocysteine nucleosidase